MGKYDKKNHIAAESSVKIWIANELAEANRLKRIELELRQDQFHDPKKWIKLLEDRA